MFLCLVSFDWIHGTKKIVSKKVFFSFVEKGENISLFLTSQDFKSLPTPMAKLLWHSFADPETESSSTIAILGERRGAWVERGGGGKTQFTKVSKNLACLHPIIS